MLLEWRGAVRGVLSTVPRSQRKKNRILFQYDASFGIVSFSLNLSIAEVNFFGNRESGAKNWREKSNAETLSARAKRSTT
jgi:hypothetical protein